MSPPRAECHNEADFTYIRDSVTQLASSLQKCRVDLSRENAHLAFLFVLV